MALLVVSEEAHSSLAGPQPERSSFMLAFAMWPLDLQHRVAGREDDRDVAVPELILQLEPPLLRALLDEPREPILPGAI